MLKIETTDVCRLLPVSEDENAFKGFVISKDLL